MTDDGAADRAKQFEFLRLRAAKLLGVSPDHQSAYVRAGIDLAYELSLNDMIDTGRVREPASFIKLSEMELQSAPPPPLPDLSIEFVENVTGVFQCSHCGERNEIPDHRPRSGPPTPSDKTLTSEPAGQAEVPSTDNVVAMPTAKCPVCNGTGFTGPRCTDPCYACDGHGVLAAGAKPKPAPRYDVPDPRSPLSVVSSPGTGSVHAYHPELGHPPLQVQQPWRRFVGPTHDPNGGGYGRGPWSNGVLVQDTQHPLPTPAPESKK